MSATPSDTPRRYDIDALRVLAFGLLILYHVCMAYVWDWGWHVKSSYQTEALQVPMLLSNRWRMCLLFLISGLAIGFTQAQSAPGRFAWSRTGRLLVPLLFGMVAIVPVQAYCQGVSNGLVAPGFGQFLVHYFTFQPWPQGAFDGWKEGITWNHLWYVAYLWVYTLLLMATLRLGRTRLARRIGAWFIGLRGARLLLLPALPFVLFLNTLLPFFEATNNLTWDWFQHAQYFTVFLIGFLMARSEGLWTEIGELRQLSLCAALWLFLAYASLILNLEDKVPLGLLMLARTLRGFYMWTALLAVLGYAHTYLNRPFRWLPYATESVFPWYILHQSLTVMLVYWLAPKHLGGLTEFALVLGGTVLGCLTLCEFVIRRVRVLRPLFGLKAPRARPARVPSAGPLPSRLADDAA